MQLSIRDASRFVIGAAIICDMASKNTPESAITIGNVSTMALRDSDGQTLRSSIEKLADQESAWFRSTPPHTLATERVMQTRALEARTLNASNLASLTTLEFGASATTGNPVAEEVLQTRLQAAVRAIDEMPGSTSERKALLQSLKTETTLAHGDASVMAQQLRAAQKTYLDNFRQERLAAYTNPSLDRSDDLDFGM